MAAYCIAGCYIFLSMFPEDLNAVFYYGTLLGYVFLGVIAIPFLIWFLSWVQKNWGGISCNEDNEDNDEACSNGSDAADALRMLGCQRY